MADVFENLAKKFNALPEQIQEAYEEATIEEIDNAAETLKQFLRQNSGSSTLNAQMVDTYHKIEHEYYERSIDWDDNRIVNVEQGKSYGRDIAKPRAKGKRNFSFRPATYHDLAYIINHGHGGVVGNSFITRGVRRVRNWSKNRDATFERKLKKIGDDLTEE